MKLRDAYRQKIEAQIEELNARLALARAKAKVLGADARIIAYEELADTEPKIEALKEKLKTLGSASEGAWSDMKGGVENALNELNTSAKRAFERFK